MKKACLIFLMILMSTSTSFAFSLGASTGYGSARNYAKYYPQYNYSNRYKRQQKNYIFSPQQAKYYGYRIPSQQTTNSYCPYSRGY